ncbi:MAG: hypothetical protein NVS3B14_18220 [Ktedonobacteraceae bacterium]
MSGYIGNDGSALAGGLNPSNQVQGLSIDATGKLYVNLAQWNGATPAANNPVITEQNIQNWLRNGQVYRACTGTITSPSGVTTLPVNLFNPNASGKKLLLFSARLNYPSNQTNHQITSVAANPAYASPVTPVNLDIGNGGSSVVTSVTFAAVNTAVAGTQIDQFAMSNTGEIDALGVGGVVVPLLIEANKGVTLWVSSNTGGNTFSVSLTWAEF